MNKVRKILSIVALIFIIACSTSINPVQAENTLDSRTITVKLFDNTARHTAMFGVDATGVNLDNYKLNPLLLLEHRTSSENVIGKTLWIEQRGNDLVAQIYFFPKPKDFEGEWFPDRLLYMMRQGVLGVSINIDNIIERPAVAQDLIDYGPKCERVVTSCELIEISVVYIGAFSHAVPLDRLD